MHQDNVVRTGRPAGLLCCHACWGVKRDYLSLVCSRPYRTLISHSPVCFLTQSNDAMTSVAFPLLTAVGHQLYFWVILLSQSTGFCMFSCLLVFVGFM